MLHQITPQYHVLLDAWRPICTCGWVGDLVPGIPQPGFAHPWDLAQADGKVHEMFAEKAIDWSVLDSWLEEAE